MVVPQREDQRGSCGDISHGQNPQSCPGVLQKQRHPHRLLQTFKINIVAGN